MVYIYHIKKDEQQLENKKYTVIIPVSKFIKYVDTAKNVFSREEYEKIKDKPIDLTCAN